MSKALTKLKPKTLGKQLSKVAGVNGGYAPSAGSLLYWDFRNTPDSVASTEINSNVECVTEGSTSVRYIPQTASGNYLAVPASTPAYNRGAGLWSEDVSTNTINNSLTAISSVNLFSTSSATVAGLSGKAIVADTTNGQHYALHLADGTIAAGTEFAASVRFKYTNNQYAYILVVGNGATNQLAQIIDLTDGSLGDSLQTNSTLNRAYVTSLGNNEYILTVAGTLSTEAVNVVGAGISSGSTIASTVFAGTDTEEVSYSCVQLEADGYSSSPIITSGSPVTRIACSTSADLAASGLTFPTNDYDLVIKGKLNKIPTDGVLFGAINATTPTDDYLAIFVDNSTTVRAAHENSTVAATDISVTVPAISVGDTFTCTLNKRSSGNSTLTWNATSNTGSTNWNLDTDAQEVYFSAHGALGCGSGSNIDIEIHSVEVIDAS